MEWARELADALLSHFEDSERGGFYFTSHDHETLIQRPKPGYDNALPSGNGVAAFSLHRLGLLLGQSRYLEAAERCVRLFYPQILQHPIAYPSLLAVLDEQLHPPRVIVLRGPAAEMAAWKVALTPQLKKPDILLALPNGLQVPDGLAKPESACGTAWVCTGSNCQPPVTDLHLVLAKEDGELHFLKFAPLVPL